MRIAVISLAFLALYFCGQVYATPPPVGPGYIYVLSESENGGFTRLFKVGATGAQNQNTRRGNLNTGNARPLRVIYYTAVTRTRDADNAVKNALRPWHVNMGGGTEWYRVSANQWPAFSTAYGNAVRNYMRNEE